MAVARHFGIKSWIVEPPPDKPQYGAAAAHEPGTNRQNAGVLIKRTKVSILDIEGEPFTVTK